MRRVDVLKRDARWVGVAEGGEIVADEPSRAEAVSAIRGQASPDDPITVQVHAADGSPDQERVFRG